MTVGFSFATPRGCEELGTITQHRIVAYYQYEEVAVAFKCNGGKIRFFHGVWGHGAGTVHVVEENVRIRKEGKTFVLKTGSEEAYVFPSK